MTQRHWVQEGTFHVTTVTKNRMPWCTMKGVPEIIIDNMVMTRNIQKTKVYAFCILPDHVHMLIEPGPKGVSAFMHSFKLNSSRDIRLFLRSGGSRTSAPGWSIDMVYWQHGFHDERIRDDDQFNAAKAYIESNATNHDLIENPMRWRWSSLTIHHITDTIEAL